MYIILLLLLVELAVTTQNIRQINFSKVSQETPLQLQL